MEFNLHTRNRIFFVTSDSHESVFKRFDWANAVIERSQGEFIAFEDEKDYLKYKIAELEK